MSTPMQQQYDKLKEQYSDCILLFRLGDFYEGFHDDAKVLSKVLGINLTGRGKEPNRTPMAGIPHHALKQYLPKLIKAGYKVAIAEQTEEASPGKIVERDVRKVVTPGTFMDEDSLDTSDNNFIASLYANTKRGITSWGLAVGDLSTGHFTTTEYHFESEAFPRLLLEELFRVRPSELLVPRRIHDNYRNELDRFSTNLVDNEFLVSVSEAKRVLTEALQVNTLKGFGVEEFESGLISATLLYNYLERTQKTELGHIRKISRIQHSKYMLLDSATIKNLELVYPLSTSGDPQKTLYGVLNECATPMGQRLLRQWILRPLFDYGLVNDRQKAVAAIYANEELREQLNLHISGIMDLERVLGRIGTKSANARDMNFLKEGLKKSINIIELIVKLKIDDLSNYQLESKSLEQIRSEVIDLIEQAILEDPAVTITEGNIIKPGYNSQLDEIKSAENEGKDFIKNLQKTEIESTGISSLKVRFNKVFGYYIEVSKSNLDKVPDSYVRKQTLVNAERYITDDLKKWEEKILGAEEKAAGIEYELFEQVRSSLMEHVKDIQVLISKVAQIDVLLNFANVARSNNYCRPELSSSESFDIKINEARHPVVEKFGNNEFIPNDIKFTSDDQRLVILTGPNMSGKSTYIRQVALIVLMAQIGSFIPADSAKISLVDRIFTRVGASDNLASGESTFMVEMNETANILNNATENSLLILDEVGRGTSTYDGVAIAWSIVEYLANSLKAKTLFATHYHELIALESKFPKVKNYNVQVKESGGKIVFMYKIVPGATDQSYGIHVAELAGVPGNVISRAKALLLELESEKLAATSKKVMQNFDQMSLAEVDSSDALRDEISNTNINTLTPLDALQKLQELKDML